MKSSSASQGFRAIDPTSGEPLDPVYTDARLRDIDAALSAAAVAAEELKCFPGERIAALLEAIAGVLEGKREEIVERCRLETGYSPERVIGEFGRMVDGMRMFARVAREGSWLDVRIDHGDPSRQPFPKPDLRKMNVPIGPVVVFGASNFPLALSVAGSDVASAIAAGCPVVVKAHPSHPGTSELLAGAIDQVARAEEFPEGTFAMLQGASNEVGQALVEHPEVRAVAFTGSNSGGRAIFDLAARREVPVPVYAEMGSVNPQFVFPHMLAEHAAVFAQRLFAAATNGNGQFCTNPGLVFVCGEAEAFRQAYSARVREHAGAAMLNSRTLAAFDRAVEKWRRVEGLELVETGQVPREAIGASAIVARISLRDFEQSVGLLQEEVFGPVTLLIECPSTLEFKPVARRLGGQLGASVHGTDKDLAGREAHELVQFLSGMAGRVLVNGFPTGLEACDALHHGGPYPATTDPHWTSVGTAAISRFGRPVAFQDVPDELLPDALKDPNPLGLARRVDGELSR